MMMKQRARGNSTLLGYQVFEKDMHPTLCVALVYFDQQPSVQDIRAMLQGRLEPRLRSIVTETLDKKIEFVEIPEESVDLEYHIRSIGQMNHDQLIQHVESLYPQTHMPRDKPLWHIDIAQETEHPNRTIAIFVCNHCISDGVGLVSYLLSLSDMKKTTTELIPPKRTQLPSVSLIQRLETFLSGVFAAIFAAQLPADSKNQLKMPPGEHGSNERKLGVTDKIPLDKIKELRKIYDCSVNDIIMALLTLTLRRYYESVGDLDAAHGKKRIRGNFVCNMRNPKEPLPNMLCNYFGFISFKFPFLPSNASRSDVVYAVKDIMDSAKYSPEPKIGFWMASNLLPKLPRDDIMKLGLQMVGKPTCMLSNLPGPTEKISLNGFPISDMHFFAMAEVGLYMGVFSYDGQVTASIALESRNEKNPHSLTKFWKTEFDELYNETMKSSIKPPIRQYNRATLSRERALKALIVLVIAWIVVKFAR